MTTFQNFIWSVIIKWFDIAYDQILNLNQINIDPGTNKKLAGFFGVEYISTLRRNKAFTKNSENSSLGSCLLHCIGDERMPVPYVVFNTIIIETAVYFP